MKYPKQLKEITIEQMENIALIDTEDDNRRRLQEVAILCNTDYESLINDTDIEKVNELINGVKWFYDLQMEDIGEPVFEFNHKGINYSLVKELSELTFGQWIDLDLLITNNQDNAWAMTRFIITCLSKSDKQKAYFKDPKDLYNRADEFKSLTLDKVFNYTSYFFKKKRKWNQLSLLSSTLNLESQSMDISTISTTTNGDGQGFFMTLLAKILLNSIVLVGWIYTKYLHYFPSKMKEVKFNQKQKQQ